jgi:uncharacterized protein (TIGR02145 family)
MFFNIEKTLSLLKLKIKQMKTSLKSIIGFSFVVILIASCQDNPVDPPVAPNTVTDINGNVYQTVVIGSQEWMAENLKTTKYCNGDAIEMISGNQGWSNATTGAWCYLNNDVQTQNTFGNLYNGYAVEDIRNICPCGWRVPTMNDWHQLINSLGGADIAGGKLKKTSGWYNNGNGTNESGFSALPNCVRQASNGVFWNCSEPNGALGWWWSSTSSSNQNIEALLIFMLMHDSNATFTDGDSRKSGRAVRCIKN